MKYVIKEVIHLCGKAIHTYNLLNDGDRILIGYSGGYDSVLLIKMLEDWKRKAPIKIDFAVAYLDPGFCKKTLSSIKEYLKTTKLSFIVEETDFGVYAHSDKNLGKSPCFICSMLRRKRLFELTHRLGFNKLALGHNQDDLIETFFINLIYSGNISTMLPKQSMFNGILEIIRPLSYIPKEKITKACIELGLPEFKNPCPSATKSHRQIIRNILNEIYRTNKNAKGNIFRALQNVRKEYLP